MAGPAAGEDVDGFNLPPIDSSYVAEVRCMRIAVGEDFGGAGVYVAGPCGVGVEEGFDCHV